MNNKLFFNNFLKTMLISLIVFEVSNINIVSYLVTLTTVWILFLINFKTEKSNDILDILITISLSSFLAYMSINTFNGDKIFTNINECIWTILFLIFILYISIKSFMISPKKEYVQKKENIIPKRKKDLERILKYLNSFNIIGINAIWGLGKSFTVDALKDQVKDKYEIIEIDILACNLDELLFILVNEIEKIMHKNKIASRYSKKLKSFISDDDKLKKIFSAIINDNYSYSETIKGFKRELEMLDKNILIIYEDIDRISDENTIKKIFWISEKLCSDKIKIIYQYEEKKLQDLGFTNEYIEKYIPYKINLTELSFFEIVEFELKDKNIDKYVLNLDDFDFFKDYMQASRHDILNEKFDIKETFYINVQGMNFSIRKVEHFLNELENILKKDEEYIKNKETVISFFYVKHFISDVYEILTINCELTKILRFEFESDFHTIDELYYKYKNNEISKNKIIDIFKNSDNIRNYCILKLFDYRDENNEIEETNGKKRVELIETEPIESKIKKIHNQKKDRIIWNLLANGKSKDTNQEFAAKKFIKDVLDKPTEEQLNAYMLFNQYMYQSNGYEDDNKTPFIYGSSPLIELFQDFRIINTSTENEIKLVDIYMRVNNTVNIDEEFIRFINYCSLKDNKLYIAMLKRINKLNICGNLNSKESFNKFLKLYIKALSHNKYINTYDYYSINSADIIEGDENSIIKDLENLLKKIAILRDNMSKELSIDSIRDELETIISFIQKMIDIIKCKNRAKDTCGYTLETQISSSHKNEDEFQRLLYIKKTSHDEFIEAVENSYSDGKISVYEIDKLISKK